MFLSIIDEWWEVSMAFKHFSCLFIAVVYFTYQHMPCLVAIVDYTQCVYSVIH